jgi:hypothetical protein
MGGNLRAEVALEQAFIGKNSMLKQRGGAHFVT